MDIRCNQGFNGFFKWLFILNQLGLLHHVVYFIVITNGKKESEDLFLIFPVVTFQ